MVPPTELCPLLPKGTLNTWLGHFSFPQANWPPSSTNGIAKNSGQPSRSLLTGNARRHQAIALKSSMPTWSNLHKS